ncbi:hypothetical protein MKW92_044292 [Papaver armeniacum]|nr:hypothetical protein MKW92_044292 [Papaver armeniacum]
MGKPSKRSEVVAAVSHAFVNTGEGNNKKNANKRDAEQKLNLKRNKKFYEPESRVCSLKAFHDISYDEFITQTWIGEDASAKPVKRTAASKTLIASNLPVSIDKFHVIQFFKQVGDDIVDVRFHYYNGKEGKFRVSFALVEFATEEAANKAKKFQHLDLLGYDVRLSPQLDGTTGAASKRLVMKGLPYFADKSDVIKFFKQVGEIVDVQLSYSGDGKFSGSGHIEFVTEEAAKKAVRLNEVELLGSCVELYREAKGTGTSRTLCLKNVPLSISKSHVIDFFENVGDIADVRFSYDEYSTFRRIVHVEFATEEAAKQAVKRNGRDLEGWPVELGIVGETLCVQGFDTSTGIDQIRIFLKRHFRTCKSIIHMDRSHHCLQAFHRALDLDGQEVDGTSLTIKDSVPVYLDVGGTGARKSSENSWFRGYGGASLGKAGSYCYPPAGNRITFDDI